MTNAGASNDAYRGTRVAVLGASGFIGRWVTRALCKQGAHLFLVVRDKEAAIKLLAQDMIQVDPIEADLRNLESTSALFRNIRPAITFNLTGYGVDREERDETTAYDINARLLRIIAEAIAGVQDADWQGQDLVHVGSAQEYGAAGGNLREDTTARPTTVYGKSKLAGTLLLQQCCKALSIKGLTARLFTVYGPGEPGGRLLPALLAAARTGKPLPLTVGNQKRDFTYVENVAEGLLRLGLASTQPGEVVNLATGKLISVRCFAETACEILGIPKEQLIFGALPVREEEMAHKEVCLERLRQLIAWVPPIAIEEGIRKTAACEARCAQVEG